MDGSQNRRAPSILSATNFVAAKPLRLLGKSAGYYRTPK
jgi:hypothetical protein